MLAESTLAAGWTQVFVVSSASGYCPCSAWDKPQTPCGCSSASPACPSAPELQPQLDSGLGEAEYRADHEHLQFRCSQALPVRGSAGPIFFPHNRAMLESTHSIFLQRRKDVRNQISFFTQFTSQARGESTEGLGTKIDVWPMALSRTCSFKTAQWLGRIEGCDLSDAAAVLLTEGDK